MTSKSFHVAARLEAKAYATVDGKVRRRRCPILDDAAPTTCLASSSTRPVEAEPGQTSSETSAVHE
eukprot:CAMPEP_0198643778 /NCGR_PEP_ID=MMETSP1467-20131203/81_1 /TAXON_ID=1462469 /ORGANISM="unid. sp., Strain CCMP2135" /LENGTH=65 /DNA_ID=CAMNT_0044379191 /DNA_START=222 /DNA_END=419 /DNA_ORIENTATION=-